MKVWVGMRSYIEDITAEVIFTDEESANHWAKVSNDTESNGYVDYWVQESELRGEVQ